MGLESPPKLTQNPFEGKKIFVTMAAGQTLNSYYKLYFVKYYRCIYRYF